MGVSVIQLHTFPLDFEIVHYSVVCLEIFPGLRRHELVVATQHQSRLEHNFVSENEHVFAVVEELRVVNGQVCVAFAGLDAVSSFPVVEEARGQQEPARTFHGVIERVAVNAVVFATDPFIDFFRSWLFHCIYIV